MTWKLVDKTKNFRFKSQPLSWERIKRLNSHKYLFFFYYLVATLTCMESVKTAEVMLRGNVSGNYIAMNTKGELYSTVSQRDDCLKFNVPQYSTSYTKRTPNQGHVSFFQTIKPQLM